MYKKNNVVVLPLMLSQLKKGDIKLCIIILI